MKRGGYSDDDHDSTAVIAVIVIVVIILVIGMALIGGAPQGVIDFVRNNPSPTPPG